jgi:hypothetical protein
MKKTVEFMVEENAYYNSDMEYKIVESYYPEEYGQHGYDIYRVEVENISDIHIVNETTGIEYEAEQADKFKNGSETVYYVSIWNPVH